MRTVLFICGFALALLTAGVGWGGDTKPLPKGVPPAHQREAVSTASRQAARPAMTDAQLEAAIRAKFAKSKINEDGEVTKLIGGKFSTSEIRSSVRCNH